MKSTTKDRIFRAFGYLGIVLTAIILLNIVQTFVLWRVSPSGSIKTVIDFREWMPEKTNAYMVLVRGSTYYTIQGPFARVLPSGKSLFVFDENGNFVGWSSDAGDNREPAIVFDEDAVRTPISIEALPGRD